MKRTLLTLLLASFATSNVFALALSQATLVSHHENIIGKMKASFVAEVKNIQDKNSVTVHKKMGALNERSASLGVFASLNQKDKIATTADDSHSYTYEGSTNTFILNLTDHTQYYDVTTRFNILDENFVAIAAATSTDTVAVSSQSYALLPETEASMNYTFPRQGQYSAMLARSVTQLETGTHAVTYDSVDIAVNHAE